MSLTASDGTGLRLHSVVARAAVEGPIALTELHLSFDNPTDNQVEGRFAITLPPGAAISRFAMKLGQQWQEGEVVERQAARRAYEDFLHRRQDPALLENDAGNVFRARVFPIEARARKELIIAYSQTLPREGEPWRLPLCGLPKLDQLDVDVAIVHGAAYTRSSLGGKSTTVQHLKIREQDFSPTQDLEAWAGDSRAQGVRHADLAIARIKPDLEVPAQPLQALTILFDTSASRALDFSGQVERLGALVQALHTANPDLKLRVAAFDQALAPIYDGPARDFGQAELKTLRERGAMGASDLQGALSGLARPGLLSERVLLVGDGVATAGELDAAPLAEALRALQAKGVQRFDALVDGGIVDAELLNQLTRDGLDTDGVVLDARMELPQIVDRLGKATRSGIKVNVPGAEWVWPRTLDGVQPGDEILIYAQLPPERELQIELEGAQVANPTPSLSVVPGPLLGRAHAEARIAGLQAQLSSLGADAGADKRTALKNQIITLSTRHRVLSDFTALLVLETESDYRRFNIDRNALTDVLQVGPSGVAVIPRVPAGSDSRSPDEPVPQPEIANKDQGVKLRIVETDEEEEERGKGADFGDAEKKEVARPTSKSLAGDGFEPQDADDGERPSDLPPAEPTTAGSDQPFGGSGAGRPAEDPAAVDDGAPPPPPAARPPSRPRPSRRGGPGMTELRGNASGRSFRRRVPYRETPPEKPHAADPWDGPFGAIMDQLSQGKVVDARQAALRWRKDNPGDVLALVAIGETLEAQGKPVEAARAYGSLIDLFPSRADLRRMAGERLERLGDAGLPLALDTYDKALQSRPDQPSGARLLAYAQAKQGKLSDAFDTLAAAFDRRYPGGRFAEIHRILREDLGLIGKALIATDPSQDKRVRAELSRRGATLPSGASTRFVLTWETDANDVDLHVYDAKGNHAFYSNKVLASGGDLYADVTTGYGPECFTINGTPGAGPYTLQAHYYRRGPMGYGMGKLQVLRHDGRGGLEFEDHPFVIMKDDAYVDLAKVALKPSK